MQIWNPDEYARSGSFVHGLAGGVMEWLDAQPGEQILDLGCGDGQLTLRLAATGANVSAVDASPEMVAAAKARGVQAEIASGEALPHGAEVYEAVFSNAVLHWVREQDAMIAEVHRVLKPGGRFVAEMGGHGNIAAIRVALAATLARHGYSGLEESENYYPTPESYGQRLQRHGFAVERIALIPRPTPLNGGGMAEWIRVFRRGVLERLPAEKQKTVVQEAVELLAPVLRDEEGNWVADYVRLRFMARR